MRGCRWCRKSGNGVRAADVNANPSGAQTMLGETEYADRLALLTKARAGDPQAIRTLAEKYKVRIGIRHVEQEATMRGVSTKPPKPCPKCGKELKPNGYGPHVDK